MADVDAATAVLDRFGYLRGKANRYATLAELSRVPESTLWHRDHSRVSNIQKGVKQQYLTIQEEKALLNYILRMSKNGYPLPVIVRQRISIFQVPGADYDSARPPGKNWPQAFYKRHPELKSMRIKALDWERHDLHIYNKIVDWFTVVEKELAGPHIHAENIYNMDETGVLLSVLNSLKVLVGKNELRNYR